MLVCVCDPRHYRLRRCLPEPRRGVLLRCPCLHRPRPRSPTLRTQPQRNKTRMSYEQPALAITKTTQKTYEIEGRSVRRRKGGCFYRCALHGRRVASEDRPQDAHLTAKFRSKCFQAVCALFGERRRVVTTNSNQHFVDFVTNDTFEARMHGFV